MKNFEMVDAYRIECLVNLDESPTETFDSDWNANIVIDKNNLFYGIATNEMGYEYLISGVYIKEKGIKVRLFLANRNYVMEYTNIINEKNVNGTVYGILEFGIHGIGECKFVIEQNKNLDVKKLSDKINNSIFSLKNNKLQASLFLDCINNSEEMSNEINECYKKGIPFMH